MARAFGNLCRELFGSHLFIKGKLVIDTNCNVFNIDTMTAANVCVNENLIVKGNADIGSLLVPNIIGNLCAEKVNTHCLAEKSTDAGIIVVGNTMYEDAICVDLIKEQTPGNGVCIGEVLGFQLVTTTVNNTEPAQSVSGDAAWQSFVLNEAILLGKVNIEMTRTAGFTNAAMQARVYQGVSTDAGDLLGTITLGSYNGGDIDFSSLGLIMYPGTYTLQMDYPFTPPANPINYTWAGHSAITGEPQSSASNITLHLSIFALSKGGIKVGSFFTCIKNKLKLEICEANCNVIVSNVWTTGGMYDTGFLDVILDCGGVQSTREISFDGNILDNVCANIITTDEINPKSNGNIDVNGNIFFCGNTITVKNILDANCTINRHTVLVQNNSTMQFVTNSPNSIPIPWTSALYDPDLMFTGAPEIISIAKTGVYHITAQVNLYPIVGNVLHYFAIQTSNDAGGTWVDCARDIKGAVFGNAFPLQFSTTSTNLSCDAPLLANNLVRVVAAADSVTNQALNHPGAPTPEITYLSVRYVHEIPPPPP